jgi:hypothetical protein
LAREQYSRVEFEEFRVALAKLPSGQHEALLLVGASGDTCRKQAIFFPVAAH